MDFSTYILQYSVDNKNHCSITKLFSCGDDGIFSNNKPCVLLLKDAYFYNVWGYDFLFNDIDTPKIGKKEHKEVLLGIKSYFVYVAWYRILMIIYMFVEAGVIIALVLMMNMKRRHTMIANCFATIAVGSSYKNLVLKVIKF